MTANYFKILLINYFNYYKKKIEINKFPKKRADSYN